MMKMMKMMKMILGHDGLDAPIREDCAVCIGHLSKLLSWSHYLTLFRKVYGLVRFLSIPFHNLYAITSHTNQPTHFNKLFFLFHVIHRLRMKRSILPVQALVSVQNPSPTTNSTFVFSVSLSPNSTSISME